MMICGQDFNKAVLDRIDRLVREDPEISRRELSRRVCEWLDWKNEAGKWRDMSCRKALCILERKCLLNLPPARIPVNFSQSTGRSKAQVEPLDPVEGELPLLGKITLELVGDRRSLRAQRWNGLMEKYHYLGRGKPCGAQLRYLFTSSVYGPIGGIGFSAAAWRLAPRDQWIGWDDATRARHLQRVVCNSRFLIRPEVRVPNLASRLLSLSLRCLAQDWQERYGYAPVLVETFVDTERWEGTCYRASNWLDVGLSAGRGRQDGAHQNGVAAKKIFLYPLQQDWQEKLGGAISKPSGLPEDWREQEFGSVRLGDIRLEARLKRLADDFFGNPGSNIPEACGSPAGAKAAYRFFGNERVNRQEILRGHFEATEQRMKSHSVVLAVQDTTSLNYSAHPGMEGIGPIKRRHAGKPGAMGLELHSTLAFTPAKVPLGLLDVQCWARDLNIGEASRRRQSRPIEQKESFKWIQSYRAVAQVQRRCPELKLISVGDRDADCYELFCETLKEAHGPHLLVRAARGRMRNTIEGWLWELMDLEPSQGTMEVHIPRNGSRPARDATLSLSFRRVALKPPVKKKGKLPEVAAWAVYVRELNPPQKGAQPIEWMLLSTLEVKDLTQAVEVVHYYSCRWGIEVFHRTLKSGCRIEDRRLGTAESLEACLAIDMVIAWRTFYLVYLSREAPDVPCTVFFEDDEWKALVCFVKKIPVPPTKPPSLRDAHRMVASLGGFLGRKGDGNPGTQTTWRGLQRLDDIVEAYRVFTHARSGCTVSNPGYG